MTCVEVRENLVVCWGDTDELGDEVLAHLRDCPECRVEALLLRETRIMLRSLPAEHAPARLTESVLARLAAEETQPGLLSRIAAWFVPEDQPSWARAAAVGVGLALAVAGGSALYHGAQPEVPRPPAVVASAGGSQAEYDELLMRHRALEASQALADDPGVTLVMYTSR